MKSREPCCEYPSAKTPGVPVPRGEVAFNGYSRFAIWAAKHYHGTQSVADLIKSPGFDDPHEPERWDPKLQLVNEILLTREPEVVDGQPRHDQGRMGSRA